MPRNLEALRALRDGGRTRTGRSKVIDDQSKPCPTLWHLWAPKVCPGVGPLRAMGTIFFTNGIPVVSHSKFALDTRSARECPVLEPHRLSNQS